MKILSPFLVCQERRKSKNEFSMGSIRAACRRDYPDGRRDDRSQQEELVQECTERRKNEERGACKIILFKGDVGTGEISKEDSQDEVRGDLQ